MSKLVKMPQKTSTCGLEGVPGMVSGGQSGRSGGTGESTGVILDSGSQVDARMKLHNVCTALSTGPGPLARAW